MTNKTLEQLKISARQQAQ